MFSRQEEIFIFNQMGEKKMGPRMLGGNGKDFRIEEFIKAEHPTMELMCSRLFRISLARKFTELHKVQIY